MVDNKIKLPTDITKTTIAVGITSLVLGILLGHFVFNGSATVTNVGTTTVNSQQTNEVIGTYRYHNASNGISIEDLVNAGYANQNEDGTYSMPSTESVVAYARAQILRQCAKEANIEITDEDITKFAKDNFGVSTVDEMSELFNMTPEQVKSLVEDSLLETKYRESIVGETNTAPAMPDEVEEGGDTTAKSKKYLDYIAEVAGDKFDKKTAKWADKDSDLAKATADVTIDTDGASYDAAIAVYNQIYSDYATKQADLDAKFKEHMNDIYKDATIEVGTMVQ